MENGQRIRKNFATRAETEAERSVREIARLQSASGIPVAATRLADAQLHEAESAFALLKDKPQSLLFYLDFALKTYRAPETEKPLAEAITAHVAKKNEDHDRTLLSLRQLLSIQVELNVLVRHFPRGPVSQFNPQNPAIYLNRGKPTLKTYNNRRGLLSAFFKFCLQNDWIVTNPVEKTAHHRINHRRGRP